MRPLTHDEIRGSFVNLPGEASEVGLPWWLDVAGWEHLDYLGWIDPAAPERAYLVTEFGAEPVGVMMRLPKGRPIRGRRGLCNLCRTQQPATNTVMMVAPRAGAAGRNHNTVGTYICADLACSLYVRRLRRATGGGYMPETLDADRRVARLRANLAAFVQRVVEPVANVRAS